MLRFVPDQPTVIETKPEYRWTIGESALAFRLVSIMESDYFVPCIVQYATLSHGLPLIVDTSKRPVLITLDSQSSTIAPILRLYDTDFESADGVCQRFHQKRNLSESVSVGPKQSTRRSSRVPEINPATTRPV